jgi:hypothetical protein
MEGRGVTNFTANKPSHGFTTSTTEFDDQLIQRGIVTTEQAMMAKGATMEDAFRLAEEKRRGVDSIIKNNNGGSNWEKATTLGGDGDNNSDVSDDDSFEVDFGDDAFLQNYRQERLDQLKLEQDTKKKSELLSHSVPSSILHICRDDWKEEVNEESMDRWVVITLTDTSGDRRDRVVQELHRFAREFCPSGGGVHDATSDSDSDNDDHPRNNNKYSQQQQPPPRLLTIDASEAIPNWPAERVPAMFAYRYGVKQHEWIAGRRGEFPPREILEQLFRKWNVI